MINNKLYKGKELISTMNILKQFLKRSNQKVAGHKINTQKSLTFLYTNNEKSEREIKESIPFTTATKIIKYLGIYLPKEQKNCIQKTVRH